MDDFEVREAGVKGKGLFALRPFGKGELVLWFEGEMLETSDPSSLPKEFSEGCFPFDRRGSRYYYVKPTEPWKYVNHSCEPNCGIKNNRELVAMREIKKGEEITFDYSTNNIDGWKMECKCGSRKCRGVVSGFEALDPETKEKYREWKLECFK